MKWSQAQSSWAKAIGRTKAKRQQHWGRDVIIYPQGYSYKMQKVQNKALHGASVKESNIIKANKCKERIQQLYQMS